MENLKQEMPYGRLKAEIRPLVSLPTAKPLGCCFTSCQEFCILVAGRERTRVRRAAPKGGPPNPSRGGGGAAVLSNFLVFVQP